MEGRQPSQHGTWTVVISSHAKREMRNLPIAVKREARDIISGLSANPMPYDSLELHNNHNIRRIRFYYGERAFYRIIYQISEPSRSVRILRIAYRDGKTYRGFDRR